MSITRAQAPIMIFLLFCCHLLSLFPTLTPHCLLPLLIEGRSGKNEGRYGNYADQGGTSDMGTKVVRHVRSLFSQAVASSTWGQSWLMFILKEGHSSLQSDFHWRFWFWALLLSFPCPSPPHSSQLDWIHSRSLSFPLSYSIHSFILVPPFRSAST